MGNEREHLTQGDGIAVDSLPRWLRDLIDINNESAGRETGRVKRFSNSSDADGPNSEEEKAERRFNALMRLLQDPEYAALYTDAVRAVDDAGEAAARALDKLNHEAGIAGQRLEELTDNAAELPDGRKVFRGDDGRLYAEDGSDVTAQKDSIRGLSPNTASWEEFKRAKETAEDIERRRREVDIFIRDVIDPAKRRLADPDHPLTPDELRKLKKLKDAAPADVQAQYGTLDAPAPAASVNLPAEPAAVNSAAADKYVPAAGVKAPDLFAQFSASSTVVADQFAPQPGGPKLG